MLVAMRRLKVFGGDQCHYTQGLNTVIARCMQSYGFCKGDPKIWVTDKAMDFAREISRFW